MSTPSQKAPPKAEDMLVLLVQGCCCQRCRVCVMLMTGAPCQTPVLVPVALWEPAALHPGEMSLGDTNNLAKVSPFIILSRKPPLLHLQKVISFRSSFFSFPLMKKKKKNLNQHTKLQQVEITSPHLSDSSSVFIPGYRLSSCLQKGCPGSQPFRLPIRDKDPFITDPSSSSREVWCRRRLITAMLSN